MKKITLLLIIAMSLSINATAKKTPIVGKWLLTKVEMNGKTQDVYQEVEFKNDGYMAMMGRVLGKWNINNKSKTLTIESDMVKEFAGVRTIKTHTKYELIIEGEKDKMFFTLLDSKKIEKENKKSNLAGTWIIKSDEGDKYLTLELPDNFKTVFKTEYSTSKASGNWYYNSKDKTVVIIAFDRELRGKNTIVSVSDKELVLDNNGTKITAIKQDKEALKKATEIERLKFTTEDFYTEDGSSKYENDVEKLPWKDVYLMYESLSKIKSLDYVMLSLVDDTKAFEEKKLTANITTNTENEVITFDKVFVGFDRNSLPDDTEMPTLRVSTESDEYITTPFPYDVYTFRVVNQNQELTTAAGTFTCTTVELFGDFDAKIKVWLVNDRPGIVAKIIIDDKDPLGNIDYTIFELTKINQQ